MSKIKDILTEQPDKWASIVGKLPVTFHDTEEEANTATKERFKILGDSDALCLVERKSVYSIDAPEMMVMIDPENKDKDLQLGQSILQVLGKFAAKVNKDMRGTPAPRPQIAKTQRARPTTGASMEWGGK